jgi:hypothetical protein
MTNLATGKQNSTLAMLLLFIAVGVPSFMGSAQEFVGGPGFRAHRLNSQFADG